MIGLFIVLIPAWHALAAHLDSPHQRVGTLQCRIVPNSGFNLLIHSSKAVYCKFSNKDGELLAYYKGEIGMKFGVDMNLGKHEHIVYAVLSTLQGQRSYPLYGNYAGVSGSATFGLSAGDSAPLEKHDKRILLQPVQTHSSGVGAAAGFTYLSLRPDKR